MVSAVNYVSETTTFKDWWYLASVLRFNLGLLGFSIEDSERLSKGL